MLVFSLLQAELNVMKWQVAALCRKDNSVGKTHVLVLVLLQAELNVMKWQVAALCRKNNSVGKTAV
jgi:hypothetical protein